MRLSKWILIMGMIFALCLCLGTIANAETYGGSCGSGVTWSLDTAAGVLEISGSGSMNNYTSSVSSHAPWYSYRSSITTVDIKEGVSGIGNYAFYSCTALSKITIPNGLANIGSYAFNGCTALESITIPGDVKSIGSYAFKGCDNINNVYTGDLNDWLEIDFQTNPLSNPIYNAENFYINNELLTELTIPGDFTAVNACAFAGYNKLTSVTIPESVESIGDYAFYYCTNLANLTLSEGLTSIGMYAFNGCSSIESITMPSTVTFIDDFAFYGCTVLNEVHIKDLKAWFEIDFQDHDANPLRCAGNLYLNGELVTGELIIPEGCTAIGAYAFDGYSKLTSITIPESVKTIGKYAFRDCTGINEINWNAMSVNNLTSLDHVFGNAGQDSDEISLTFGPSVRRIPAYAFYNIDKITNVTMGKNVTFIGDYAFFSCDNLDVSTFSENIETIGEYAFEYCVSLKNVILGDRVKSIGFSAFNDCSSLEKLTIGENVTSIGDYAFSGCYLLNELNWNIKNINDFSNTNNIFYYSGKYGNGTAVTFGDSVQRIPAYALRNIPNVTSITIGENVTDIGNYAFSGCSLVETLTIPASVRTIGDSAFAGWKNLKSLTIPETVTSIGTAAFRNCTGLTEINWNVKNISDFHNQSYVFAGVGSDGDGIILTFGPSVRRIPGYLFNSYTTSGVSKIKSVTMGDSVESIGECAFYGCDSLESVTIGRNVASIEGHVFDRCSALTELKWNAKNAGDLAKNNMVFYQAGQNGTGINVVFGSGVEKIPAYAFYPYNGDGNPNITTVTIGNSVESIGDFAFNECSAITDVYYYGSEDEWANVTIGTNNSYLLSANIVYKSIESVNTRLTADYVTADKNSNTINFRIAITSDSEPAGILIVAVYDNSSTMIGYDTIDISEVNSYIEDSFTIKGTPSTYKAFFWNSLKNVMPLCDNAEGSVIK